MCVLCMLCTSIFCPHRTQGESRRFTSNLCDHVHDVHACTPVSAVHAAASLPRRTASAVHAVCCQPQHGLYTAVQLGVRRMHVHIKRCPVWASTACTARTARITEMQHPATSSRVVDLGAHISCELVLECSSVSRRT